MTWLLLLLSCTPTEPPGECVDDGDCDGIAICDADHTCRQVECLDSSQCGLGNHCSPDANACFTGCLEDTDCIAGQVCDTATTQCIAAQCDDAEIDCWYGELCGVPPEAEETAERECYLHEAHCVPCSDLGPWPYTECTETHGGVCYGGDCLLPCDPESDTPGPRGFECIEVYGAYHWFGSCGDVDFDRE